MVTLKEMKFGAVGNVTLQAPFTGQGAYIAALQVIIKSFFNVVIAICKRVVAKIKFSY